MKIGRYKKETPYLDQPLESENPISELTLDNQEFTELISFLSENYSPFKDGIKKYIAIDESLDADTANDMKRIFENPNKKELLKFIKKYDIVPDDILVALQQQKRIAAVKEFEVRLKNNLVETNWQPWFKENAWILGTEFVRVLDERRIDLSHISDYLMEAYDGFLDIVEIKRPEGDLKFWEDTEDHGNPVPSTDLIKAITQVSKYIFEVEREANDLKYYEKIGVKVIKPRCILIFGRSIDWNNDQREAYRILNSGYHNITILTYDHVLLRAKRILGVDKEPRAETPENKSITENVNVEDLPF